MDITFAESEYPGQVNVKIDEETDRLVKLLREKKVRLGPILRPIVCEKILAAAKELGLVSDGPEAA